MANRFLNNIRINDAYTFPASDGNDGQVITTDGAGNLAFENISPDAASVIYRDNFTGDGSTVTFDLQNSITDEDQTQIYIDGVYQEKSTYSISGTTITFTTAPILGHSVEVISISSINTGPTVLYQDNFTGNGNDTAFTLGQIIDNEIKTFIFLNGVYQFKNTYTVDGTTLTFDTAPANGVAIEVVSIASAVQSDSLEAGSVIIPVKNTHTASIAKGTPVYITGNVGASERLQIAPADASNSAKMPAAGLLLTTLAVNAEGYVITGGYLRNITTDTIDGTSTSSNDTVYVKAGGGLTMTKPTGSNLIQNIAKVARSASGNSGSLIVSSILRTNDIPNLTTGKIWVGSANNTIESGTLHLDESNNRLGINNNNPSYSLDVTGDANISSNVIVGGNLTVQGTETILNTQTVEVEDNILQLNTTQGSPDTATATTSGISIYRGDGVTQASFIFDDADDTWDLTNNLVVDGNVGIGQTPSTAKLEVAGEARVYTGSSLGYWGVDSGNSYVYLGTNTSGYGLSFQTAGTERMRIDSSGNVMMGKNSQSGNAALTVKSMAGGNTGLILIEGDTTNDGHGLYVTTDNKFVITRFTNGSYSDNFVMDSSGNVGIGITLPESELHIKKSEATCTLTIEGGKSSVTAVGEINSELNFGSNDSSATGDIGGSIKSITEFSNGAYVGMGFYTAQQGRTPVLEEAMRINYAGNVGIGTNSPTHLLTLEETDTNSVQLVIDNFNTSDAGTETSTIRFRHYRSYVAGLNDAGEITVGKEEAWDAAGARNSYMSFGTRTGASGVTEKMRIDSSGDVQVKGGDLSIEGGTSYNDKSNIYLSNGRTLIQSDIVNLTANGDTSLDFKTRSSGSTSSAMFIDEFRNIGIGTTNPDHKLQVNGSIKIANSNSRLLFGTSGGTDRRALEGNTAGTLLQVGEGYSKTALYGDVGIGNTSPIAQLDVAGNTNQHHSVSTTHNGGWKNIQNLGAAGWLDQTYSAGRLKVFGYENGSVNISYCEYYVIRHNSGYSLNQIGTRLSVGNGHGQVDVQISGNFLQVKNALNSSLGVARVVFSGMKD